MQRFTIFIILLLFACPGYGQLNVHGFVNGPAQASVTLRSGTQNIRTTTTDNTGRYFLSNIKAGNYQLTFTAIGFTKREITLSLTKDTLINLQLMPATNNVDEVQVTGRKALIERKIDRTVFNAEKSIAAIGTDALELLAKIPGISVVNDQVAIVGKGAVNVMINDRLVQLTADDLANYLKSIPSDNISKIEIITNPPARYDAQGNNGLINIVLKQVTTAGFKGALNTVFSQATHSTGSAGINLSYKKDKITLNGNFNVRKGSLVPFEQSDVYYPLQTWNIVNKDRNYRTVPGGNVGIDFQSAKGTLFGASYTGGHTNFHSEEHLKTTVYKGLTIDSILNSEANATISSNFNGVNLFFKQQLDTGGKQLTINGDWFSYNDTKSRFFDNTSYYGNGGMIPDSYAKYLSDSRQDVSLYTLKADIDLPYKTFKLAIGAKLSFIENNSDVAFYKQQNTGYVMVAGQTNLFNYREHTQAVYINFNTTIAKFTIQAGLRAEHTQTTGISADHVQHDNSYLQVFPTLFLVYPVNSNNSLSLNYGRRINRPQYKKLNPFRWYSNQFAYTEGNPFLQPAYNNNIEFVHIYKNRWTNTIAFSETADGYNDVNFVDALTNTQVSRPVNFITGYNYQVSTALSATPLNWMETTNQVSFFYNKSNSAILQTLKSLDGFSAYLSTTNQFTFNPTKTLLGDIGCWYQFAGVEGLSKQRGTFNLDLGLKALLINKKLQLAISATDLFKTGKQQFSTVVNNIYQSYNNYYDSRSFKLTMRYSFGNEKVKQQNRTSGNDEERRRNN